MQPVRLEAQHIWEKPRQMMHLQINVRFSTTVERNWTKFGIEIRDYRRDIMLVLVIPPAQGGSERSIRLLLTKNPPCSFSCPLQETWYLVWTVPAAIYNTLRVGGGGTGRWPRKRALGWSSVRLLPRVIA